jgi:murein DD-endopeptidase MepM/ murein hydrolase activator NlpD
VKRLIRTIAALIVMALAIPALGQVTDEDIDRARRAVNEILADSEALGVEVQEAWARQFSLEKEISDLNSSIEVAKVKITETERKLEEVAVEMYMGSTAVATIQVLFSTSDEAYGAGFEYLRNVSGVEGDVVNQLRSFRTELGRQTERLAEASVEQQALAAELEVKATELQGDLVAAQGVYEGLVQQQAAEEEARRRAEEEARRRAAEEAARNATTTTTPAPGTTEASPGESTTTAPDTTETTSPPPPPSGGGGTCPVAGAVSFTDSWGAPRSGGRAHQGVDMIAARNTPVVAIYSGTIRRISSGNLSGLSVWLRAGNGDTFFYAHLESYGDISVGQSVDEGQVIGYNGSSGNAPSWLPHLHFEHHPGGGSAVNPYPLVRSLC